MTVSCFDCNARSEGWFCDLRPALRESLSRIKQTKSVAAGEILFHRGEYPRGIFLLVSGNARLAVFSADGRSSLVRVVAPGEILGLSATVSGRPYEATAEAIDNGRICFVERRDFLRFLEEHGKVCAKVVQMLSDDLGAAYDRVRSVASRRGVARKREPQPARMEVKNEQRRP